MDARTLLLHADGSAELVGPRGNTLWASNSDERWQSEAGGEYFIDPENADQVIEYLIREQYLTDAQAGALRVYEELEADDDPPVA